MRKRFAFSIKMKFMLVSTLIMAFSSVTWGSWFYYNEKEHLRERLEAEGRLLLTSIQAPIIDTILYEEIGIIEEKANVLDNYVEQLSSNKELDVVYAFVTDDNGKVLAHSNLQEFGKIYQDPLTKAALAADGFVGKTTAKKGGGAPTFDMAIPLSVAGKNWGALRVGVSMASMVKEQNDLGREILAFSGLFFLVSNAIFYVVGLTMARPLQKLSLAMAGVNYESLDGALPPKARKDEIGQLQDSFSEMLNRLKKTEQERQRAVALMIQNEKLATIGKLVAGVAHEINNPLMVMSTSLYQLERKLPQDLVRYLDPHKEGMQRIETIVRQLSDFSRVGTLDLQNVPSDAFFQESARFAGMALKRRNLSFVMSNSVPPTVLSIDKGKMHQVVLNLIINAADASPSGAVVQLLAYSDDYHYFLEVRDQGGGIPPGDREKIFEIFFTTKPGGEGTGIGLAISKSIVEMHAGEISVASRPGETIFLVRIPWQQGADHA